MCENVILAVNLQSNGENLKQIFKQLQEFYYIFCKLEKTYKNHCELYNMKLNKLLKTVLLTFIRFPSEGFRASEKTIL